MPLPSSNDSSPAADDDPDQACYVVSLMGGSSVVRARGEIDLATSPGLAGALREAMEHSTHIVVDLQEVTFLDSTALNVLVSGFHRVREHGGEIALVGAKGIVRNAVHVTGLHRLFTVGDSVEEAVTALSR